MTRGSCAAAALLRSSSEGALEGAALEPYLWPVKGREAAIAAEPNMLKGIERHLHKEGGRQAKKKEEEGRCESELRLA